MSFGDTESVFLCSSSFGDFTWELTRRAIGPESHRIGGNRERKILNKFSFSIAKSTFSIAKIDTMAIENV